ncbi:sulfatase family protein [Lutibacter citreus]|uniref:sulfatase family protein n=1 Tax=Lutibacter citreus TaxID=2138210 RepID=UPI000DBE2E61|nr:arylsulfatase [Lutibacter citreus]
MKEIRVLKNLIAIVVIFCGLSCSSNKKPIKKEVEKPNIIYILADDMGIGDVQAYNKEGKIPTPNIDRLAQEGMMFTDAHTNSSVCTPTRYGILTGRYAWRTSLKKGVLSGLSPHLINIERETVATFLKKQGYATACIGKWHLGMDWKTVENPKYNKRGRLNTTSVIPKAPIKYGPNKFGFDYYYGIAGSLNMSPHAFIENDFALGEIENLNPEGLQKRHIIDAQSGWVSKDYVQEKVLSTFAKKTCKWIEENKDEPFFVYFPLPSPHSPIVPSEKFKGKSGLNLHGDFCMETDWVVGEVLNTLDKLNLSENTIVIYTADNGTSSKALFNEMQAKGHYSSLIYRGCKGSLFEGGHRVPFLVRWPENVKANTKYEQAICTTDLLATFSELFDKELPNNIGEDSKSFLSALKGKSIKGNINRAIVHHSGDGSFAIRKGKWKLVFAEDGGDHRINPKDKPIVNSSSKMLFNMQKDAIESINVSSQYPKVVEELTKELAEIIKNGRSTFGANQPTNLKDSKLKWPQIKIFQKYLN